MSRLEPKPVTSLQPQHLPIIYHLTYDDLIIHKIPNSTFIPFNLPNRSVIIESEKGNHGWGKLEVVFYGCTEDEMLSLIDAFVKSYEKLTIEYKRTSAYVCISIVEGVTFSDVKLYLYMFKDMKEIMNHLVYDRQHLVDYESIYYTNKYVMAKKNHLNIRDPKRSAFNTTQTGVCVSGTMRTKYRFDSPNLEYVFGSTDFCVISEKHSLFLPSLNDLHEGYKEQGYSELYSVFGVSTWKEITDKYHQIPVTLAPPIRACLKKIFDEEYITWVPLWEPSVHGVCDVDYVYVSVGLDKWGIPQDLKKEILKMMSVLKLLSV